MVRVERTVAPNSERHAVYSRLFRERYSKLYPALRPLFHQDAGATTAPADTAAAASNSLQPKQQPARPSVPRAIVAPSILAADFSCLGDEVARVLEGGADAIHVDMFDGTAIGGGNFTVGPPVVAALRKRFPLAFLDCHIAVQVGGVRGVVVGGGWGCL